MFVFRPSTGAATSSRRPDMRILNVAATHVLVPRSAIDPMLA
jgi:hypothetical protein